MSSLSSVIESHFVTSANVSNSYPALQLHLQLQLRPQERAGARRAAGHPLQPAAAAAPPDADPLPDVAEGEQQQGEQQRIS